MFKLTPAVCLLAALFTGNSFAATTENCEKYFKTIDNFMAEAQKNEAMKGQTDMLKSQYEQAKTQMAQLPADTQDQACKQGLDALEAMMKSAGIAQ